jgi:hypothetical protein
MDKLIRHQVAVRAGLHVRVSRNMTTGTCEYHVGTEQGRVFVVLGNHRTKEELLKAQIDVIAQLNQIMNNVSIKRA